MHLDRNSVDHFVALIGAPNSGKTTLYNWLTNSRFKTVNYPGATIEYSLGRLADRYKSESKGQDFPVMDTPGTYSLFAKSADELVTLNAIYNHPLMGPAGKIILVVDGTQLNRHLLMARQLKEAGFSFVMAVTMSDLLRKNQIELDLTVLEKEFGTRAIAIDGLLGGGIQELVKAVAELPWSPPPKALTPWNEKISTEVLQRIEWLSQETSRQARAAGKNLSAVYEKTARLDRFLLHPVFGLVFFFLIMWGLFSSIYWGAAPAMDWVDGIFASGIEWATESNPGLFGDFLGNGVIASFGAVFIFVPQIFILFVGIGLLESSGYLARAATLIDKPFSKVGLSGRSFVPLLSGFACAVPAVMATRNISSSRDRWITNFVIPLMSCSARLPVYSLLLGFLFIGEPAWKAGFGLAVLYIIAALVGATAAAILNKILVKTETSFFMMELPIYRRPQLRVILRQAFVRTKAYVRRAGPPILIFAVLIWMGTTFPNYQAEGPERLQSSYMAQMGQGIEPLFQPMGVDWRVGVGLISAFAAREVFVSSMAVMFNITDESQQEEGLLETMKTATNSEGALIFTPATVVGLLIFFMIALQCMSTVAIQMKENKSKHFALIQLVVFNVVAYGLAVALVQGLRALGVA
ncbi:MAG: ferrous iron transporter B [Pseudobdellovibrionaceae bacterium]